VFPFSVLTKRSQSLGRLKKWTHSNWGIYSHHCPPVHRPYLSGKWCIHRWQWEER